MKSLAAVKAVLVALRVAVDHPSAEGRGIRSLLPAPQSTNEGHSRDAIQRCRRGARRILVGHAFSKSELQAAGFNLG